ncbi:MAG: hypothetical protein JRI23_14715 [Deltaproteobacteria bacterium]|jgi:hypothetical protein|nr:hypothetical protein [Deltaproteobacteria bacterium]MBW2533001.1 hypothetical protein [Deltaproteobacteria bacterium]
MAAALTVFVGGLLVWSGINLVHGEPPGALWTPEDLPDLPADHDNGWRVVADRRTEIRQAASRSVDATVRSWLSVDPALERPTREALITVEQASSRPAVRAAAEACEAALAKPAFVDGCPVDGAKPCPALEIAQCNRLNSYGLLRHVSRGQWDRAGEGLERLIAHGEGHLGSARSVIGMLVALRNQQETTRLGGQLWAWALADDATGALAGARRRWLAFDATRLDGASAVIGEYLQALHGAVQIDRGEAETGELGMPGFFFDAGATIAELNRLYRGAGGVSGATWRPAAPPRPYAEGAGWWIVNPLGKLYLDAVLPPPRVYDALADERSRLVAALAELKNTVGAR